MLPIRAMDTTPEPEKQFKPSTNCQKELDLLVKFQENKHLHSDT